MECPDRNESIEINKSTSDIGNTYSQTYYFKTKPLQNTIIHINSNTPLL